MSTRTDQNGFDLDEALARLAAEAAPGPALQARVLADAAIVSAGRRPAPAAKPARRQSMAAKLAGLFPRPAYGVAGAVATVGLSLALVVGLGVMEDESAPTERRFDETVLSGFSPLDSLEREVLAVLDEDILDLDPPL